MTELQKLKSLEEFLFGAPLYAEYVLPDDLKIVSALYGKTDVRPRVRIDGHCPDCGRETTFDLYPVRLIRPESWTYIRDRVSFESVSLTCVREESHEINYWFHINKMTIKKVGQFPSLADISNDEVKQYRRAMSKQDGEEFHKAIGLAAHGVGVGAFVYLRRVFERLIDRRYRDFRDEEAWTDEDFNKLRMTERVKFLKNHLPDFLVENAEIYSKLSLGVHELDEQSCLGIFDVMKHSIIIILDEDKKKQEELAHKKRLADAIEKFAPSTGT